ncbi:MAG: major capsid protein V20 domain-containing protein, partial [Candidatus Fonsibacter sp.]
SRNISINFNNQVGLLSSMTPEQLYRSSLQSGQANMSWDEFCGSVISCCGIRGSPAAPRPYGPYVGLGANLNGPYLTESNPGVQFVPTTGSILVLNFAEVIQLTEELYAPGSLGSFNLQLQVTVENNQNTTWLGSDYELVIKVMNSGVCVNERGTSSIFIGLLTNQDVLDALQQQPYNNKVRRMVGGGFLDNIRSGLGWITSKLPMVRGVLE